MRVKLLTGKRFGLLTAGDRLEGNSYQCSCECGGSTICHANNLRNGNSKSCGCLRSTSKLDEKNPGWKGDKVGYAALHEWVKRRLPKPTLCEVCLQKPPLDLANKSNAYLRDLSDWWYLCRGCHMTLDGRIEGRREYMKSVRGVPKHLWKERA